MRITTFIFVIYDKMTKDKEDFFMNNILFIIATASLSLSMYMHAAMFPQQLTITEPTSDELLLINAAHQYSDEPQNLTRIPYDLANNVHVSQDFHVNASLITPLQQMFHAAAQDGVQHFTINSAYRSTASQQKLYTTYGAGHALPPMFSEHETGLSLDIGSTVGLMENAAEGKWLAEHAASFGFVVRYPAHKTDITGIKFEPWHLRYVGLPHSKIMAQNDFVLEEYIPFLRKQELYEIELDGVHYVVQYTTESTLNIPDTTRYTISETNEGGYVVTSIVNK